MTSLQILLYGPSGGGKTTLANSAESPLFIDLENGTIRIKKDIKKAFPIIGYNEASKKSMAELNDFLDKALRSEGKTPFKTLVIDSITRFDKYLERAVVDEEKVNSRGAKIKTLGDTDFGSGYVLLSHKVMDIVNKCIALSIQKDMDLILIAHTKDKQVKPKNGKAYDAVEPSIDKRSLSTIVELMQCSFYVKADNIVDPNNDNAIIPSRKIYTVTDSFCEYVKDRVGLSKPVYDVYNGTGDAIKAKEFWAELYKERAKYE